MCEKFRKKLKNWVRTGKKMIEKSKTRNLRKFEEKLAKKFERNTQKWQKPPKNSKKSRNFFEN